MDPASTRAIIGLGVTLLPEPLAMSDVTQNPVTNRIRRSSGGGETVAAGVRGVATAGGGGWRGEARANLQATAPVHEAYLRLVDGETKQSWENRRHFFAAAAEAMRGGSLSIGGASKPYAPARDSLDDVAAPEPVSTDDVLMIDEALTRLAAEAPDKAELVRLRYFAGLSLEDAAEALGISRATASRHWTYARAWLYRAVRNKREQERSNGSL